MRKEESGRTPEARITALERLVAHVEDAARVAKVDLIPSDLERRSISVESGRSEWQASVAEEKEKKG